MNTRGIGWCYTHRLQLRSVCCKRTSRSRWSVTCWKQTNVCRQHDDVLGKSSNKNTSISATRRHPHQQQEDVHISNKNTSTSATRRQQKEHINISNQNTSTSAASAPRVTSATRAHQQQEASTSATRSTRAHRQEHGDISSKNTSISKENASTLHQQ